MSPHVNLVYAEELPNMTTNKILRNRCENCTQIYLVHALSMAHDGFCSLDCASNARYLAHIHQIIEREKFEMGMMNNSPNSVTCSLPGPAMIQH